MAKCVKDLAGNIERVDDAQAKKLVDHHNYMYAPKWAWKAQRDVETIMGDRKR